MSSPRASSRRRVFLALLAFGALAATVAGGLSLWRLSTHEDEIARSVEAARPWMLTWRVLIFVSIVGFWRRIATGLAARYGLNERQRRALIHARWRVAAWWIVLDLVLVENALWHLARWLGE